MDFINLYKSLWILNYIKIDVFNTISHDKSSIRALFSQRFYDIIGTKNDNQVIKSGVGFINHEYDIERVRQILVNTEPAIEGQGGDNHTYKVCCIGKENGLSPAVFFELLWEWNEKCEPAWGVQALYQKMLNAYKYGQNSAGSHSIENMFNNIDDKQKYQKIKVLNFQDFLEHKMPPKEFT